MTCCAKLQSVLFILGGKEQQKERFLKVEIFKQNAKLAFFYVLVILKWIAVAAVVGAVGGAVGVAFHVSVEKVTELRAANDWIVFLLPPGSHLSWFAALSYRFIKCRIPVEKKKNLW